MPVASDLLFLLVLATGTLDTPAVAGVTVTQAVETYPVAAATSRQLLDGMNAQARVDPVSGKPAYGYTYTHLRWSYATVTRDGTRCAIDKVDVGLDVRISLPDWQPVGTPPAALRERWRAFHAALTAHELQHRAFGMQAARGIREAIEGIPAGACAGIDAEVTRRTGRVMQQLADANRGYDIETDHGRTEGAVWVAE